MRKLLARGETVPIPGVFSPSVALLAEKAGFRALYLSGAAFSGLLGLPDVGMVTSTEVAQAAAQITSRVDLPLIVDIDTGFGEVVNVARTVSEMERVNVAAVQIEDQVMPKRCGHLEGKELVEPEGMVKKVVAARDASRNIVIVARTDAASVKGIDSAVERARLYVKAGADVIFPEALRTRSEFKEFARKLDAPLLANMTEFGKTEYIAVSEFSKMGYELVIFPVTTFRVMMGSVRAALEELSRNGTQKGLLKEMMTREEFYDLIDYDSYARLDSSVDRKSKRFLDTN
ncbi:MAG: methylisocitrate lyase [Thaumarchaeota archaeon]|nr:methylisocitrate lyase [Nitrososphaerota archaeon]